MLERFPVPEIWNILISKANHFINNIANKNVGIEIPIPEIISTNLSKNPPLYATQRPIKIDKRIAIVKAGEVYLVVAVGKDDVTLLTQLTEEQLSEVPDLSAAQNRFPMDGKAAQENFREVLNRVKEHFPKK